MNGTPVVLRERARRDIDEAVEHDLAKWVLCGEGMPIVLSLAATGRPLFGLDEIGSPPAHS